MTDLPDVEEMPNPWINDDGRKKKNKKSGWTSNNNNNNNAAVIYVDEDTISPSDRQRILSSSSSNGQPIQVMQYVGADGSLSMLTPQEMQRPSNIFIAGCCPCFISCQPCSPQRKSEYKNLIRMASLWVCVVDLIVLIVSIALDGFAPLKDNFSIGGTTDALVKLGAQYGVRIRYDHEVWRFVTAMFLHSGIVHYLFNALATIRFCVMLERKWGTIIFCALYAAAGVAASILSAFFYPNGVSVGASGAICGIFGAYCAEIVFAWRETHEMVRKNAVVQAVIIIAMLLFMSFLPHVDAYAHLGGLGFGFLAAVFVFGRGSRTITNKAVARIVPWAALILSVLYFVITLTVFFTVFKPKVK